MRVVLWRGYHSREMGELIRRAWRDDSPLIVCPPSLSDYRFLRYLPFTSLEFAGDWDSAQTGAARVAGAERKTSNENFSARPVFGVFTSGTSGNAPRLALYSKLDVTSSLEAIRGLFDVKRLRRIFCYPQPFHTFGLTLGYMQAALYDLELVTPAGKYSSDSHDLWHRAVTPGLLTLGAPTHFHDLLAFAAARGITPAPSYAAIVGGAPVSVALWRKLQGELKIEQPSIGYGATEAAPGVTHLPPGVPPFEDGEIGYALPHLKVENKAGEGLRFSNPHSGLAMIGPEGLTLPTSILLSDDVERRDDGRFIFRGRLDLTLNRGGEKFPLEMIEAQLASRLNVASIAVAVPDERLTADLGVLFKGDPNSATSSVKREKIMGVLRETHGPKFRIDRVQAAAELPMNASAKPDRKRAAEILRGLYARQMSYPVSVDTFKDVMPHRAPAIWVDEVTWVDRAGGECRVRLNPDAHYFGAHGKLRSSSCMEWMAQSYAFITACQTGENFREGVPTPRRAFLVAMRSVKLSPEFDSLDCAVTSSLLVRVQRTHQFGPISLIQGSVVSEAGVPLAEGQLRIFVD